MTGSRCRSPVFEEAERAARPAVAGASLARNPDPKRHQFLRPKVGATMEAYPYPRPTTSYMLDIPRRVAIACVQCRSKKVKCITDSQTLTCMRCYLTGIKCHYVPTPKQRRAEVLSRKRANSAQGSEPAGTGYIQLQSRASDSELSSTYRDHQNPMAVTVDARPRSNTLEPWHFSSHAHWQHHERRPSFSESPATAEYSPSGSSSSSLASDPPYGYDEWPSWPHAGPGSLGAVELDPRRQEHAAAGAMSAYAHAYPVSSPDANQHQLQPYTADADARGLHHPRAVRVHAPETFDLPRDAARDWLLSNNADTHPHSTIVIPRLSRERGG
ncbi:Zn(2)-C6 fungal-type domain-containing protein [Mycena kentingensis (nom. inval.)]|nr:Zn(2)-C6 fungal-type domain-containing protein [Mycena kentingensis (nom. inval.)]